jgi:hypothetical protein
VFPDGSVVGTVQFQGAGPVRRAFLPANTLQVRGNAVCASVKGLPMEPCFSLARLDANSFRGSITGLGFAYCEFTRNGGRAQFAERVSGRPVPLRPSYAAGE